MNLRETLPQYFPEDEIVEINLDNFYKQFCPHSHEYALEMVFAEGAKYVSEAGAMNEELISSLRLQLQNLEARYKDEIGSMHDQYTILQNRYDILLAKVSASESYGSDPGAQNEALNQTLGMGNVFKVSNGR